MVHFQFDNGSVDVVSVNPWCVCVCVCVQDLCWYEAQKTDQPEKKGAIPITHVRLVYMSEGGKLLLNEFNASGIVIFFL